MMSGGESSNPPSHDGRAYRDVRPRRRQRGYRAPRCLDCRLPEAGCICDYRPTLDVRARFWLVVHELETDKPTNTGRLIGECIPGTRASVWETRERPEGFAAFVERERLTPYLVFPDDHEKRAERAVELHPDMSRSDALRQGEDRVPLFVLLDGTWAQVRRMARKAEWLAECPVVALRSDAISRYGLRHTTTEHGLCTAEVAAALLDGIGEHEAAELFSTYFRLFDLQYRRLRAGGAKWDDDDPEGEALKERLRLANRT